MRLQDYKLGDKPLKLLQDTTLLKNERCIVNAFKDTLALPIEFDEETLGYVFHGKGKLLIDSIIETRRGAVGKSTERDLKEPFLMLGGTKEISNSMNPADTSDLSKLGYESAQAFVKSADEACERFFKRKIRHDHLDFDAKDARLFAFMREEDGYDTLISKRDKLLYTSDEEVYVFKGDKGILKRPGEVVVSKRGKTVCVSDNDVFVEE